MTEFRQAKIAEVRATRINEALDAGKIVLVAGFQGVSADSHDVTTLGRGGSDTTAVALAAALITVVSVVFSVILVALTLASTQFGPRMLRNFIRDHGTQWTLGTLVGTFVYSVLTLVAIGPGSHGDFGRSRGEVVAQSEIRRFE